MGKLEFTPIAMKCTQEQFEAIKPKLKGFEIKDSDLEGLPYLANNLYGENKSIAPVFSDFKKDYNRTVHEEWNEEIFLKACGIEVESLENQLQKAEAEVKRLQSLIEEENKPKIGDWVYIDNTKCFFKVRGNEINYLDNRHKKITNPELIKLLEDECRESI